MVGFSIRNLLKIKTLRNSWLDDASEFNVPFAAGRATLFSQLRLPRLALK
jgi:hypothetical protein